MQVERHVVTLTTDASGDVTGYSPRVTGRVLAIHYVKDGSTPYDNTVDFTITGEATGETIWTESNVTASKSCAPRMATHSNLGVATLYAAGGTAVLDGIGLAADRVKFVLAQGGNVKVGAFHVVIG